MKKWRLVIICISNRITSRNGVMALLMMTFVVAGSGFLGPEKNTSLPPQGFIIDTLAAGLSVPWEILFLPDGKMLFTERQGRVRIYDQSGLRARSLLTISPIEANGKMGLLGMCLHPDFTTNHFVYLAYNYRVEKQTFLRVVRYVYSSDTLSSGVTIIENIPGVFNHTGSRLKFGLAKKLYISTGDADVPRLAQDLKALNGKILRVNDDGSIPADNPFANSYVWSYGHRNPQGLAFQPDTHFLYSSEHGPTGGDEINLVSRGNNYGWPTIHHRDAKDGMMLPLLEFTPSIGPAEAIFYSGKAFPGLKGHLLVACMRGEAILNMTLLSNKIVSYNFWLKNAFGRIRALAEGPDGSLYLSTSQVDPPESRLDPQTNGFDLLLRLRPAGSGERAGSVMRFPNDKLNTALVSPASATKITVAGIRKPAAVYAQLCAGCHGARMEGRDKIPSLADNQWLNGSSVTAIKQSIRQGITSKGMPAWEGVLSAADIANMAAYILKR